MAVIALGLLAVILLIVANGYFVAAEFAFVSARKSVLEGEAEEGNPKAVKALSVLKRLSFMLSGAQLGITVTSLVVGFIAEPVFTAAFEPLLEAVNVPDGARRTTAVVIGFLVATVGQMVLGELAPKNLAIARSEGVARALAGSTAVFMTVAGPLIKLFDSAANGLLRLVGIEPVEELHAGISSEELEFIVGESAELGSLSHDQADLLQRAIDFRSLTAADAMIPMGRVAVISSDADGEDLRQLIAMTHSRFPVVSPTTEVSPGGEIVGVVHAKYLLDVAPADRATTKVASLMRDPVAVPSSAPLPSVLTMMRASATQLAIVVDEHGGEAGIITLEDLVEELVGEIEDEHDSDHPVLESAGPDGWLVPGSYRLDEIERETGIELPEGDYDTIGGLVVAELTRIAEVGDEIMISGTHIEVVEIDRWAIRRVRLTVLEPPADDADGDADGSEARR